MASSIPVGYKLQYTIATIAINTATIRINQSVISVSQIINPIAPIIIAVIAIAAISFIRSIVIYISQNKFFHLHYHKILVRVSFIDFSIRYTFYSFRVPLSKFRNTFYQVAEFQLVSFFFFNIVKAFPLRL